MSNELLDYRDALKASIVAADLGLAADDIIVERQADIFSEIERTVSEASNGVCLVISAVRGSNQNLRSNTLMMTTDIKLSLWVQTIYDTANKAEEEIFVPLMRHLHGLNLTNTPLCYMTLKVSEFYEVPDPDYLVREVVAKQEMVFK